MKKSRQIQQAINSANRLCKDKKASDKKQIHNRKKMKKITLMGDTMAGLNSSESRVISLNELVRNGSKYRKSGTMLSR